MDATVIAYIDTTFPKIRKLRESGKGEVWLAADAFGKPVIVKHILMTGLPYKILKEHPRSLCPRILYCAEDDEETLVVEEYVQGESLLARLEEGRYLTEEETKHILLQLCDSLQSLHEQGIIHRDIKPSNLILQHGDLIRLIDFDAARTVKEDQSEDTRHLGTKGYAPPEQFGYGQTDARSDIYSIGITMQKMMGSGYQGYLTGILAKCTAIDPQKRYASMKELKRSILWRSKSRQRKLSAILLLLIIGISLFYAMKVPPINENPTIKPEERTDETHQLPKEQETPFMQRDTANSVKNDAPIEGKKVENNQVKSPSNEPSSSITNIPRQEIPAPITNSPIETNFSVNGTAFNQAMPEGITLNRESWSEYHATLNVVNKTGVLWNNPSIRIMFSDNWGSKYTETKSLPPIAPGESATFSIPVGSYIVSDRPQTSAWLQVYLNTENLPSTESYWCVIFKIGD